jgi:hypothetical protein
VTAAPTTVPTNLTFPIGKFIKSGTTDYGMMFNDDGAFQSFQGSNVLVHATYSVDGDTFTIKTNEHGCPDVPRSFKYTFDGTNLTFNYVGDPAADPCTARRGDFNNVTYTRSVEASFPIGKFIKSGTTDYGMMFNDDGTFSVFQGSNTFVQATYSVDGDTFTIETNENGCPDVPRSFKYMFDGTNLTFNYVGDPAGDPCTARRGDFNNVTYSLVK